MTPPKRRPRPTRRRGAERGQTTPDESALPKPTPPASPGPGTPDAAKPDSGPPLLPGALRSLAEIGRQVVRDAILRDPQMANQLDELGLLNPDARNDPTASPLVRVPPRRALARVVSTIAARRQDALSAAGVGGLEALAAVLEGSEGESGEPVPIEICIGFTDIEDFSRYTERHGDPAALKLLDRHRDIVEPALRTRGGEIVKRMGDGLMVRFPNAASGALAILDVFDRLRADAQEHPEAPIRIRAGLNVGRPLQVAGDLVGSDVNLAARLTDAAAGGELLVSQAVVDEIAGDLPDVVVRDLGKRRVKGFQDPVRVAELTRP